MVVSDTGGNDPVCFLGETCNDEGTSAADFSDCCSKPGAGSYKNLDTSTCQPCSGMTYYNIVCKSLYIILIYVVL